MKACRVFPRWVEEGGKCCKTDQSFLLPVQQWILQPYQAHVTFSRPAAFTCHRADEQSFPFRQEIIPCSLASIHCRCYWSLPPYQPGSSYKPKWKRQEIGCTIRTAVKLNSAWVNNDGAGAMKEGVKGPVVACMTVMALSSGTPSRGKPILPLY